MRLFSDIGACVEDSHLRRALLLAENGRGTTSPNPAVGCVIVHDGVVVGEGFHERAGGPHAEIVALTRAREAARGAIAYVTLEPCDHFGQTPPCTQALIAAGIAGVVIGMPDPTAEASGGAARLREAGIGVKFAQDPAPFQELNEAWLHHVATGLPYVHVKVALSLDGHPTSAAGVRARVSGSGGSEITMRVRAAADAVLVGAATARADEPALTVRDVDATAAAHQPLRVILGGAGAMPDAALFHDGAGESVALVPGDAVVPDGVGALRYDADGGLESALRTLAREGGVRRVLVEAGPRLFTALWEQGLINELTLVHAGGVFGTGAPDVFLGAQNGGIESLERSMAAVEAGVIRGDAVSVWHPAKRD
ncbi:MAG: bifunctional diaminohydroxyphosphoribosylaminopyrimidine deaminase/5-amino-6-(5-phosphoribosylamino)uracil reductase RibD [Coriobacteriia bacterium]